MKQEVQVPEVGESVSSGILASWLKKNGEQVTEGEDLFELETDKATMPVPSPATGRIAIEIEEETEVEVGQTVAYIDTEAAGTTGEEAPAEPAEASEGGREAAAPASEGTSPREAPAAEGRARAKEVAPAAGQRAGGERTPAAAYAELSPAVRRVVDEHDLDPSHIQGTGKDGRITKEDALKAAEAARAETAGKAAGAPGKPSGQPAEEQAKAETGAGGGRAAEAGGKTGEAKQPATTAPSRTPAAAAPEERQTRKRMSNLRKRIAENMVRSKQDSAHLTTFNEVDMSQVMSIRKSHRDSFEEKYGVRLGFMSFFIKAACAALREFPEVNAYIDGDEIVYNNFYNVGVALSTDRGLIVPVLRDADTKSFAGIESEIMDFIERAQQKRLAPDELTGGTFTISNGGVFGSMLSTPIPNPPQTAVLGMHAIQKRPVVIDDEVAVRPMMYLALTYDHRIIDGREAVRFLVKIKTLIEDPTQLLLDL